ncbi:cysteine-rich receptor-like protein kinase 2 isoform X2 [Cinnamomum micranthum f. kanehirae]|uniref:Cysteine-rich receptor-like protein kinase 2 isoform X2 n=1 Tax=Cinnamomum micranthum f. kanehirae TaxID=337451 RepID=A0A3S3N3C1_9MAGN|nr:cysteine-rich receptor-like protein kinase 2 isoform X2 [Cinnamomum micranthum f. kanehirae]
MQAKTLNSFFSLLLPFTSISFLIFLNPIASDPQTYLINKGCSQYNVTNPSSFFTNLNSTFSDIRSQLNSSTFANASRLRATDPVYVLFQCRDYLSSADCLSCFSTAEVLIRNCSAANGARVIYDGCFLRYESNGFFDQGTMIGNAGYCDNTTLSSDGSFGGTVDGLLKDLSTATPRMNGYFGAAKRGNVYGVAQCARTVSTTACEQCLNVAYGNINGCPPDGGGRSVDAGCFLRYSVASFFSDNQTTDLAPFLSSGSSSNKKAAIIGGVVGGAVFVLLLLLIVVYLVRRKKTQRTHKRNILGTTELRGPVIYHYKDLKFATKNFSEEYKLGEGGFGDVYKGVLKNGNTVAVKKLMIGESRMAKANFESEVKLISNVHHRNLIRLLGCCNKGPELMLVYEYMANSSLDKFLFGDKRGILNWKHRFNIIVGTARGLAYLHDEFHVRIIHRDIKSSNILLDDDFQPKIADFGLARLLPEDQSHLSTKFAGTLGYTAPEYAIHGQLSEKVDTYSYGVVVLEIVSGRKSNDVKLEPVTQYLLEWAWKLYESNELMKLVDERLDPSEYQTEQVKRVMEVALMCTQSSVASRPSMSEIVVLLLSKGEAELKPTRPTFIEATKRVQTDTSTSTASSASNATVSISQFSAR